MKRLRLPVLIALALWATALLLIRIRFELQGAYHTDASIYLTVSRGILNGLTPYRDLYENKPPGLFLLGALSLKLFNGAQLLIWLQALVLLLFPLCIVLPVAYGKGFVRSRERLLMAWILGCSLSLYSAVMAGQLLPESFGAFFASCFVALAALRDRYSLRFSILLAVFLLLATGTKEPFIIAALSGALIVLPSFKSVRSLVLPVAGTLIVGVLGLLLLGYFSAYVQIDLAHVFGFHVSNPWGTVGEPAWLRYNDLIRIFWNMAAFNPVLPFIIAPLWIMALVLLLRKESARTARVMVTLRWLLATLLATFCVGLTGDFYGHHFIFAVPFYTGCALVCLKYFGNATPPLPRGEEAGGLALNRLSEARSGAGRGDQVFLILYTLIITAFLFGVPSNYQSQLHDWREWAEPRIKAASVLDTVMDRCGIDRYFDFIDRPEGFYGFTRHSPFGPIFTQYGRFIGVLPVYLNGFMRALTEAKIMVMTTTEASVAVDPGTGAYLTESFSEQPWPCAGADFVQPLPYRILFRKVSP